MKIKENTVDEIIEILRNLVRIPSYEGIPGQETAVAKYIYEIFIKEGILAEIVPVTKGRCNIIATLKGNGKGKNLLLTGHTDTVAPYDMKEPFKLRKVEQNLYGRGVVDMKGSLACMIMAMISIKRKGIQLKGDVIFAGVIDEENKSEGTIAILESGLQVDMAIVGEPSNLEICTTHRGLEWFEIYFQGKTVHGGKQDQGINAIQKAAKCIETMENNLLPTIKKRVHPIAGPSTMNYGTIEGGTQPSTVAGQCTLKFDRRWIPGERYEDVVAEYQQIIHTLHQADESFHAKLKVMDRSKMQGPYIHEAMEIDQGHTLVKSLSKSYLEVMGEKARKTSFPAWSDGGLLYAYGKIPTVVFGPGELESAHAENEHIAIAQLIPAVTIYAKTAIQICERMEDNQ